MDVVPEKDQTHVCMCIILHREVPGHRDPCKQVVDSADQPFCKSCEDRHPEKEEPYYVTVKELRKETT